MKWVFAVVFLLGFMMPVHADDGGMMRIYFQWDKEAHTDLLFKFRENGKVSLFDPDSSVGETKMTEEQFYERIDAYVKMAGDKAMIRLQFDEGLAGKKVLGVLENLAERGLKRVLLE